MPIRAMVYKTLSTVIDDLFAWVFEVSGYPCIVMTPTRFIIKMPTLHRLACFRDDVVFLIFLYQASVPSLMLFAYIFDTEFQRWIYRVDPKRVNEYGQVLVEEQGESKKDR